MDASSPSPPWPQSESLATPRNFSTGSCPAARFIHYYLQFGQPRFFAPRRRFKPRKMRRVKPLFPTLSNVMAGPWRREKGHRENRHWKLISIRDTAFAPRTILGV